MLNYPLRVLLVDDDKEQAQAFAKLLSKRIAPARLEIFFSDNPSAGVKDSHDLRPCIVFLDLMFPGVTDWKETARMIPQFKGVVVVVSELPSAEISMECRSCGAVDVFTKDKINGLIEIIIHVVTNIRLNSMARQPVVQEALQNGCVR